MNKKHTILLAEKYSGLGYEELANKTIEKAKECIIDYLGCVYAGLSFMSSQIVREFALANYARGDCTVIGCTERLVPTGASFVNGTAAHAAELDDTSKRAAVHVGAVVIPLAVALGESLGLGGKDVLAGVVIGYDVAIKVGKAANPQTHLARGFHPTATCGMFGATMAAARFMNLDAEATANALGIVGSFVAGNLECYSDGSFTKRLQPGIASSSGIAAATLASKGYTGPKSILEGPRGFFNAYCEDPKLEELSRNNHFEIESISFKPHACCGFNQSPIDAILGVCSDNRINHKDIESVVVELSKTGYDIVGQPAEKKFNPRNVADCQFSAPYSVAIACIEGKALLDEFSEASIHRPEVQTFMKKIVVKHAPDLDRFFPKTFPARVRVSAKGGKTYTKEVRYAKGDPQSPLSREEIIQKFNLLAQSSLPSEDVKQGIIEKIEKLEEIENLRDFTQLLV